MSSIPSQVDGPFLMAPDIDPPKEGKTPAYIAARGWKIWHSWNGATNLPYTGSVATPNTASSTTLWGARSWAQAMRDYSRGLHTLDNLRKIYQLNGSGPNDATDAMKISWEPSMYHVKMLLTLGRWLYARDTIFVATALDPTSTDRRAMEMSMLEARVKMANDPQLRNLQAQMAPDIPLDMPEGMPQNPQELEIWSKMGPKDRQTAILTMAVSAVKNLQDYDRVFRVRAAEEMRDTGVAVAWIRLTADGIPVAVSVRVEDVILPYMPDGDFSDMPQAAVITWETPSKVIEEMGSECINPEAVLAQLERIKGAGDGRAVATNMNWSTTGMRPDRVPVLRFFFKETEDLVTTSHYMRNGNPVHRVGDVGGGKWKKQKVQYEAVYTGCWVIGTPKPGDNELGPGEGPVYWGCKKMWWQPRNGTSRDGRTPVSPDGGYKAWVPLVARGYNMTNMRGRSVAEIAYGVSQDIDQLLIQLRQQVASIIPPGLGEFDRKQILRGMDDLVGDDQSKVKLALDMFRRIGAIPVDKSMVETPNGLVPSSPLTPHPGFIGEIERLTNAIEVKKQWLYEVCGFNDASLGNTPDAKTLVGNMKMQVQGTSQTQGPLFSCWDAFETDVSMMLFRALRCSLERGYVLRATVEDVIGIGGTTSLEFTRDDDPGYIGIECRMQLTEDQQREISVACDAAMQTGTITPVDRMFVMSVKNMWLAMSMLDARIKSREKSMHDRQLEIQQAVGQAQQGTAQVQNDGKLQAEQLKAQASLQAVQLKSQASSVDTQASLQQALALEQFRAQAQAEAKQRESILQQTLMDMQLANDRMMMLIEQQFKSSEAERERMSRERIAEEANETAEEIAEMKAEEARKKAAQKPKD